VITRFCFFFNDIRNNDWDCVIMSHDQFGKIPQSPELQQRILQAELDTVEENLEVLRSQGKDVSRAMLKGLEKRKFNLTAKLEKVEHAIKSRTDDVADFRQMGIDHIFVDESHYQNFYEFPKFRIKLLILILLHFNIVRIIY
jgi:N12 class adenine-specific DNA methylase